MRIIVVGGWPRSLVNFRGRLIQDFVQRGHEVVACAGGEDRDTAARLNAMGARYVSLPLSRTGTNVIEDIGLWLALLRLFRRERPDILLAYTIKPVVYGLMAARMASVPRRCAMITGLGSAAGGGGALASVVGLLYRLALRQAGLVFFQNPDDEREFLARRWIDDAQQRVQINGSGVDLAHFAVAPLPTSAPVFLMIARLLRDKGIGEYIEAARTVKAKYPECRFLLVGPRDDNPAAFAEADIETWRQEGAVEYLGEVRDVRPHLAACHVYVLPSYREGTPRTVLEAMATGRPAITTDVPGCRQTIRDDYNGYLVPACNAATLAAAMLRFVETPGLIAQFGMNARRFAEERFDVNQVNRDIIEAMLPP